MQILELRSKSLSTPAHLVEVFTSRIHDRHLPERGILFRTFTKDSTAEYVWTYTFADAASMGAFLARDPDGRLLSTAIEGGVVKRLDVDDGVFEAPIFIVSAPRTGSTLIFELLTNSSELWSIRDES